MGYSSLDPLWFLPKSSPDCANIYEDLFITYFTKHKVIKVIIIYYRI